MSEAGAGAAKELDPMEKLRELRDAYLEVWSKHLIETVNTDSYAQASGALLNGYLTVAAPLKEPAEQAMLRTLQQLNVPSSADFAGLAGRFTNIEMQLDNMDAKLDRMEKLLTGAKAAATAATTTPAESVVQAVPVKQASVERAQTRARTTAPKSARKAAPSARGTAKRATTARPVRRPGKGTR